MNDRPPVLKYKSGVMLTDELTVKLPVGEWVMFINWIGSHDTDGINFLLNLVMEQLMPQIYDTRTLKEAEAHFDDRPKTLEDLLRQQFPTAMSGITGPFVVVCDTCGDRDEYDELPFGALTCGHNGSRHAIKED